MSQFDGGRKVAGGWIAGLRDLRDDAFMRQFLAAFTALIGVGIPSASSATRLACLPGIGAHTYERRSFIVRADTSKRLHADLELHSGEMGLSYSSVRLYDPAKKPPFRSMDSILQSVSVATVIDLKTSNRSRYAKITIGNNCFEPKEDWRPYWVKLNRMLKKSGY